MNRLKVLVDDLHEGDYLVKYQLTVDYVNDDCPIPGKRQVISTEPTKPNGTFLCGNSAEFIVERP